MQRVSLARRLFAFSNKAPTHCIPFDVHSKTHFHNEPTTEDINKQSHKTMMTILGIGTGFGLLYGLKSTADCSNFSWSKKETYGEHKSELPTYTMDDVAKHSTMEKGIWISYKHGVYDITDFVEKHPGGDQILLGAGSSVEPFWNLYAVHKDPHILQLLEKYRIGNLAKEEVDSTVKDMDDPYANEPRRHAVLAPRSVKPFNAEPAPEILSDSPITPNEFFYVRNHLPVPEIDEASYELEIEGLNIKDRVFKLKDLKKMPKHTIVAALQCAGNRRSEMTKIKPVKGLNWGHAAIGNAEWTGVLLRDVLIACGVDENDPKIKHVQFEGFDLDPTSKPYGASIPIEKALSKNGDVLLAYEMNGVPLPKDHGFPVRVVVPGTAGARCVKWLSRIVVSDEESLSHWQQNDYKGFAPNVDWDTVDFSKSPAIQDMPVTSAICVPKDGQKVKLRKGKIHLSGYAYSGGGRKIVRVDISIDGGKTWQEVNKYETDPSQHPRSWGWTLWNADIETSKGPMDIVVKAVDSSYNTQPADFASIWNLRGVLSNAYHKISVEVK